METPLIKNVIL